MDIKTLKQKGLKLDPIIRIGKAGLTKNVVQEIIKHLKKRRLIKIKLLRSYLEGKDKKKEFAEIATLVGGDLIDFRGFTFVLARKGELSLNTMNTKGEHR